MTKDLVLKITGYVKGSPETMDYGRWGALNVEQRELIERLCRSWLVLDEASTKQQVAIDKAIQYLINYESISIIEGLEDIEANKDLDEKTMIEMIRRYMIVHNKLLEILKGSEKNE